MFAMEQPFLEGLTIPSRDIFKLKIDSQKYIVYDGCESKISTDTGTVAHTIDDIDAQILSLLQEHGRMQRNTMAEKVGLSVSAVSERMRKLEERGVISGYHATVDAKRLHFDITAFIRVFVDGSEYYGTFIEAACAMDEVLELHSITGEGSHVMKVRTKNTTALERFLSRVQAIPGVTGTTTSIVLSSFKETHAVPAEPMELYDYEEEHASTG